MPELNLIQTKSFSLIELLITIIIIGIALSFVIPSYHRSIERNRAKSAEVNLMSIYNAQKRQRLDTGSYYVCNPPGCTDADIKDDLGVDVRDSYFDYTIQLPTGGGNGYVAVATREEGPCVNETMEITDNSGEIDSSCGIWD